MAKPYDFESPLATENTIRKVADIIKTNYPNNETFESLQSEFETFKSDLNTLLTTLNNWV